MQYLNDSLERRLIFVTGKGGVGKTTLVRGLAHLLSEAGKRVAIASLSPLKSEPPPEIPFHYLETAACFREYALKILRFERIYDAIFENRVLKAFVRAAPGLSATVIAGKIWDLVENNAQDILVVDLPSSGHSLAFFRSIQGIINVFPRGFVREQSKKIWQLFMSSATRFDLVTLAMDFSVVETSELFEGLNRLDRFPWGFVIASQCLPNLRPNPSEYPSHSPESEFANACLSKLAKETRILKTLEALGLPILKIKSDPVSDSLALDKAVAAQLRQL